MARDAQYNNDHDNKYNGVEFPDYPDPPPRQKIRYTKEDFDDIASKVPERRDSDLDEPVENRKSVKEKVKEKEDKESKLDIKEIKRTLEDFKKGQEQREVKRDLEKHGIKD
jgi:hypothetical protein